MEKKEKKGKKNLLNADEFNLEEELKDKVELQVKADEVEPKEEEKAINTIHEIDEHKPQDKKYLRLDITDYQEYISLISEYKNVSMTNYIQSLINTDMQANQSTYDKLKQVKQMMSNI